ncbi:hypothetical protein EVG20_g2821 [Dentipellis fragilis]|uniref:Uncharacterized protein n=1 Tax=Dentipellis fragilis TaxID=205917 RepID=A0A4Y9Z5N2_9AGAM|nr:hypothetical protein EVG20_g2821 [Dentipellis fragilis]
MRSLPSAVNHRTQPARRCNSSQPVPDFRIPEFGPPVHTLRSKLSIQDLLNHEGPDSKISVPPEAAAPRGFLPLAYPPEAASNTFTRSSGLQHRDEHGAQDCDCDRGPFLKPYVRPADSGAAMARFRLPEKRRASRSPPWAEEQWRARRRSEEPETDDEEQDEEPHFDKAKRKGKCANLETQPLRGKRAPRTDTQRKAAAAIAARRREGDRVQLESLKQKVGPTEQGGEHNNSTILVAANVYIDELEDEVQALTEELEDMAQELDGSISWKDALEARLEWRRARFEEFKAELQSDRAILETHKANVEAHQAKLQEAIEEMEAGKAELVARDARLKESDARRADSTAMWEQSNAKWAESKAQLKELEMMLTYLQLSSSEDDESTSSKGRSRSYSV